MSMLRAPPGLDPIPMVSPKVSARTWADVVKPRRCEANKMEKVAQRAESDEETQANSSTLESDFSDTESSSGSSASLTCGKTSRKLDLDDLIRFEPQSAHEADLTAQACTEVDACIRLRSDAPVFVPRDLTATMTTIGPPPGLRTSLRTQAKAFVPGVVAAPSFGQWMTTLPSCDF